jgi:hypothetical protein
MSRNVIVSPFLQRRNLLFRGAEATGQNIMHVTDDVVRALYIAQARADARRKEQIEYLKEQMKQAGPAGAGPAIASQYEKLTGTPLPRERTYEDVMSGQSNAATGPVLPSYEERIRGAIPMTQENALALSGAGEKIPSQTELGGLMARTELRTAAQDKRTDAMAWRTQILQDNSIRSANTRIRAAQIGGETRLSAAKIRAAAADRNGGNTSTDQALYKGRIMPWYKVMNKPGAQRLTFREFTMYSGVTNRLRQLENEDDRIALDSAVQNIAANARISDRFRDSIKMFFSRDKEGQLVYENDDKFHAMVTGMLGQSLKEMGAKPEQITNILTRIGPKSPEAKSLGDLFAGALDNAEEGNDNLGIEDPLQVPTVDTASHPRGKARGAAAAPPPTPETQGEWIELSPGVRIFKAK